MANRKILLLDGSSLAFRAFFSILDLERFKNKAGLHTNALFSFNRMLDNLIKQFDPTHILVAFDEPGPTFRTKKYDEYKGGRSKTPSEFTEQMPYFRVLLDGYGIQYYSMSEYEADDIIGTLSHQADNEDSVAIITGDKDLIQLASDNVTVYVTKRGVSDLEPYTTETIREKYDLTPEQIIDMKGLMGDTSDNYPGVTRVGEKTALKLLYQFGTMENLYDNLDELKPSKMKENLTNEKEQALMSRDLAEIRVDVPVEKQLDDITFGDIDVDALGDFYRQMEFKSFLTNLQADYGVEVTLDAEEQASLPEYTTEHIESIEPHHLPNQGAYYTEMLEENYHFGDVIGVVWADTEKQAIYVSDWDTARESDLFQAWLKDPEKRKIVLDSKREQVIAKRFGLTLNGIDFDVLIANYLIDTHNAKELTDILGVVNLPQIVQYDEAVYGKGAKRSVPEDQEVLDKHISNKVLALAELKQPLIDLMEATNMHELYKTIEFPLANVLARLESTGVTVHGEVLEEKNKEMIERLEKMEQGIYDLAGEEFNVNSPKQLGVILFEKLHLPVIKKTKTGYSTAAGVLEKLVDKHPIIQEIMDYRQISKLQSTYLAGLPGYIKKDGKIHTRFIQTLTQTGRLSSADPNLQNIPVRIEEGRKIRQAFVPSHEGWQLFGADYSQIELRVLAHISQDEHMLSAFNNNEDIHTATARRVFNIPEEKKIDGNMRRQAKAVNFGIVYGISDYGLSQNLDIPRKEAKEIIDTYFDKYPDISTYMADIVEQARTDGYVSTLFQRRRYLPDIKASNFNVRSFAERTAMNSPIQGTAADILKIAMIRLQSAIDDRGLQARILLQVHDELILEAPADEMEILSDLVPEVMEHAVDLDVPLKVDYNQGNDWYELD